MATRNTKRTTASRTKRGAATRTASARTTAKKKMPAKSRSAAKAKRPRASSTLKKSARMSGRSTTARSVAKRRPANDRRPKRDDATALRELFIDGLKDIYWAENHLLKALPKMHKAATSQKLKAAIMDHIEVTRSQAERVAQVFELLGEKARGKKCEAMDGLTKEGDEIVKETDAGTATRDVGIIMAAQKVEHYEIASYGTLAQLARTLGNQEAARILDSILKEEKETDVLLTQIAEGGVNYDSLAEAAE